MTTKRASLLLEDLAKLLAKHGSLAFDELAEQLSHRDFVTNVSEVLRAVSEHTKSHRKKSAARRHTERSNLPKIQDPVSTDDDPEKNQLLKLLEARLRDRSYFPRLQDIRELAENLGLKVSSARKRDQLVLELNKHLVACDKSELSAVLARMRSQERSNALSAWSDLIVSKDERGRPI